MALLSSPASNSWSVRKKLSPGRVGEIGKENHQLRITMINICDGVRLFYPSIHVYPSVYPADHQSALTAVHWSDCPSPLFFFNSF